MLPASELGQSKHSSHFLMFRCCRSSQKIFFFYLTVSNYGPDNAQHKEICSDATIKNETFCSTIVLTRYQKLFQKHSRTSLGLSDSTTTCLKFLQVALTSWVSMMVCECAFRKTSIHFIEQSNLDLILMKLGVQSQTTKNCPFFMWWNEIDLGTHKLLVTTTVT